MQTVDFLTSPESGLREVKVFRIDDFALVAVIPFGALSHGIWPSGDGTQVYVGLENADAVTMIVRLNNKVFATTLIVQSPQAITYVPNAVLNGDGLQNQVPLGGAGIADNLTMAPIGNKTAKLPTRVTLFNQSLVQVLEAAVTEIVSSASVRLTRR